ncbi:MAG: ACP S-malonyltransferase [Lentisphaeria bacterium]|nr:ACP S-malonyltransferase [Lentisphaeria bacterium]
MKAFFVFSGQGAQFAGMGRDFAAHSPAAAAIFAEADSVLGYALSEIIFNGPEETLTRTVYCQPAIYTMSCAALAAFREKFSGIRPLACAGLSLGEYAALYAGQSFDFATGLRLIARRAEFMDAACRATDGGMASVLNGDVNIIREVCERTGIDVANYNSPGQIVISGKKDALAAAVEALKTAGLRKVIVLNVAGAFHSRLMKSAGDALLPVIDRTVIVMPTIPVYHNCTALPAQTPAEIRANLARQVAGSVRWEECVRNMAAAGGDTMIEFGPGNVLTKLCSRTLPEIKTVNIGTWEAVESFAAQAE